MYQLPKKKKQIWLEKRKLRNDHIRLTLLCLCLPRFRPAEEPWKPAETSTPVQMLRSCTRPWKGWVRCLRVSAVSTMSSDTWKACRSAIQLQQTNEGAFWGQFPLWTSAVVIPGVCVEPHPGSSESFYDWTPLKPVIICGWNKCHQ